jgi:hypothetical protein
MSQENEEKTAKFPDDEVESNETQVAETPVETQPEIKITDFTSLIGNDNLVKAEPEKKVEAKTEEKVEEKAPELPELKKESETDYDEDNEPLVAVEAPKVKVKVARDYSGIDEADKPLFEKMGNETFAAMKKTYTEAREIKKQLEETKKQLSTAPKSTGVHGHPRAYALTKEHDELVTNVQAASTVERHWQTQLARIRRGEKWQDLDIKEGKFVYSEAKEATAEDEANVIGWLTDAAQQKGEVSKQYKEFVSGYETNYKKDLEAWNNGLAQYLPDSVNPALKAMEQQVMEKFVPVSYRDHPLAKGVVYLIYELAKQQEIAKKNNKVEARKEGIQKVAEKAQPTKKEIGPSGGAATGITFDAYKNVLASR